MAKRAKFVVGLVDKLVSMGHPLSSEERRAVAAATAGVGGFGYGAEGSYGKSGHDNE